MVNIDKDTNFDLPQTTEPVSPVTEQPTDGLAGLGAVIPTSTPMTTPSGSSKVMENVGNTVNKAIDSTESIINDLGQKIESAINSGLSALGAMVNEASQQMNQSFDGLQSDMQSQANTMQNTASQPLNIANMLSIVNTSIMELEELNLTLSEDEFNTHKQCAMDGLVKLKSMLSR